jgi:alkylation response protein AidB-like acyl-CoA dehydrogenase
MTPTARLTEVPQGRHIAPADAAAGIRLEACALSAAYLVGIASRVTEMAVEYAKGREQFGVPIGSFQAVKHICADMLTRAEVGRAAVYAAGVTIDGKGDGNPARAVAAAKLLAGEAAVANGKACVQVHGGMGFTWEVDVHLFLKRAVVMSARWGSADEHAEAMAACL